MITLNFEPNLDHQTQAINAVVKEDENEVIQLYFVLETKNTGGMSAGGYRVDINKLGLEQRQKIHCGQAHFDTLNNDLNYKVVKNVAQL